MVYTRYAVILVCSIKGSFKIAIKYCLKINIYKAKKVHIYYVHRKLVNKSVNLALLCICVTNQ